MWSGGACEILGRFALPLGFLRRAYVRGQFGFPFHVLRENLTYLLRPVSKNLPVYRGRPQSFAPIPYPVLA